MAGHVPSFFFELFMSTNQNNTLYEMTKLSNSSRRRRAGVKFFDSADWAMNGSSTEKNKQLPYAITDVIDIVKKNIASSPLECQIAMDRESIVA